MNIVLIGAGIGLLAGLLAGLFGLGGGVIMIPLLGLLLKTSQHQAQGVTLAVLLLPLGLPALLTYLSRGVVIRWRLVACMVISFLPGVWVGAYGAQRLPDTALRITFMIFLLVIAIRLWQTTEQAAILPSETRPRISTAALIGLLGGLASGMLGIGGGLILIPLLMTWNHASQLEAQANSLAVMLLPIGLPGVWVYARSAEGLPWPLIAGLASGFILGSLLGARAATRIRAERLRKALALFMLLVSVSMALRLR